MQCVASAQPSDGILRPLDAALLVCATIKSWQDCSKANAWAHCTRWKSFANRPVTHRRGNAKTRQKIEAAGDLMSDRLEFDIVCPNNHNQTVAFSQEEFEEALKSGALVFHCNTCDSNWPPSSDEIADLRKQFSKEP
jgi:hypothetical protein